jgi:hypothetical protein
MRRAFKTRRGVRMKKVRMLAYHVGGAVNATSRAGWIRRVCMPVPWKCGKQLEIEESMHESTAEYHI